MEGYRAALDGGGAQAPSLRGTQGLAASLLQQTTRTEIQLAVLPARSRRQGVPPRVRPVFPPSCMTVRSLTHSHTPTFQVQGD